MGSGDPDQPAEQNLSSLRIDNLRQVAGEDATVMQEILRNSRIEGYFKMRADASAAASSAQFQFRWMSRITIVSAAVATLASGLLLYGAGAGPLEDSVAEAAATVGAKDLPQSRRLAEFIAEIRPLVLVMQIISAFITAFATAVLAWHDHIAKWTDNRRRSEELRRQIFVELFNQVAAQTDGGAEAKKELLSQALELFRRFQLDLQLKFYEARSKQSERSFSLLGYVTAILAGVTAIIGVIATLGEAFLVIAAFLGIAVPVMLSAAQSWRTVNLFGDKAKSYEKAHGQLQEKSLEITEIKQMAAAGDVTRVREFIDEVHEVMANENTNWVAATPVS